MTSCPSKVMKPFMCTRHVVQEIITAKVLTPKMGHLSSDNSFQSCAPNYQCGMACEDRSPSNEVFVPAYEESARQSSLGSLTCLIRTPLASTASPILACER